MASGGKKARPAFSLLELVIVVVIVGIVASIAILHLSGGSDRTADAALEHDLTVLRNAIERYVAEHVGKYPTLPEIPDQLTKWTNSAGGVSAAKDAEHIYGPYVRQIPPLPVGARKGMTGISGGPAPGAGWIYNPTTGHIRANTTDIEISPTGVLYKSF